MSEVQLLIKDYEIEYFAEKKEYKLFLILQGQRQHDGIDPRLEIKDIDKEFIKQLQKARETGSKVYLKISIPKQKKLSIVNSAE